MGWGGGGFWEEQVRSVAEAQVGRPGALGGFPHYEVRLASDSSVPWLFSFSAREVLPGAFVAREAISHVAVPEGIPAPTGTMESQNRRWVREEQECRVPQPLAPNGLNALQAQPQEGQVGHSNFPGEAAAWSEGTGLEVPRLRANQHPAAQHGWVWGFEERPSYAVTAPKLMAVAFFRGDLS